MHSESATGHLEEATGSRESFGGAETPPVFGEDGRAAANALLEHEALDSVEKEDGQFAARKARFANFAEKHFPDLTPVERERAVNNAFLLYRISRDTVGPVIKDFAACALRKLKPEQRALFLARDGLCPWIAARLLVRQGAFPGVTEEQLQYAQLSRKLVHRERRETLKQYLAQLGVADDPQDLLMVDVGMYGTIHGAMQDAYPHKNVKSLYLISAAEDPDVEGYLYKAGRGKSAHPLWSRIVGNPAVHFLEDTFSGFFGSTRALEKSTRGVRPARGDPYTPDVYLKRLAALTGIVDRLALPDDGKTAQEHAQDLETYLLTDFQKDKEHVMVPHE